VTELCHNAALVRRGLSARSEPDYLRLLGRPTRKYLKAMRPSPAGNGASHFRQRILPCTTSQVSTVTILYSASQPGQLKGIGSDWLIIKKNKAAENYLPLRHFCQITVMRTAQRARHVRAVPPLSPPPVSHSTQGQRAGPATRSDKLIPIANPVAHILLFWDR
jgi:hypothetical protein